VRVRGLCKGLSVEGVAGSAGLVKEDAGRWVECGPGG
jgi:hypothetical protein